MTQRSLHYQKTVLVLVLADLLWGVVAYGGAFYLRIHFPVPYTVDLLPPWRFGEINHSPGFLLCSQIAILYFFGLYDLYTLRQHGRLIVNVIAALGVQLLAVTTWYFFQGDFSFPRSVLVVFWILNTVGIVGLRLAVIYRLKKRQPVRVLLVGAEDEVHTFLADLKDLLHVPAVTVAGLVSVNGRPERTDTLNVPWVGSVEELPRVMQEVEVDEVIVLSPPTWKEAFVARLLRLPENNLGRDGERPRVLVVPSVYDILVGRVSSVRLHDVPLIEVLKNPREDMAFFVKAAIDVCIAGVLLIVSLPIMGMAAVLIKLTSPGPVFYRQQRVGQSGNLFTMYKLRTMVEDAEHMTGPVLASAEDTRMTGVGRWLRASRIDEIPQLWNVLNGTMSLVGPRPERPEFTEDFLATIPGYAERLQVKPGLTGLAQVNGEYHTTPEYKLKYDLAYIYNYSVLLDLRILTETVKVMLTKRGV